MRLKVIRLIFFILIAMIGLELFYFQVIRGSYFYNLSANNRIRVVPIEGWRGKIVDREGVLMADNKKSFNVLIIPQDVEDFEELFSYLGAVLKSGPDILTTRFEKKRLTPFTPVLVAEDISHEKAIVLEENRYRFPAILIQESFKRFYPLGENSAHVLGFVGKVNEERMEDSKEYGYTPLSLVGYSGVEEYYDNYLRGENGGLQVEVNSRGKQVRLLSLKEPQTGSDIAITIDSRIQQKSRELLAGRRGVIIVMDTDSGEVLGMTSSPDYDPNLYFQDAGKLFSNTSAPLLNRAIKGLFPPGSVFKLPVSFCALDSKKMTTHTTYECPGFMELGGIRFGCSHVHGSEDLIQAIAHSCNVYFYHIGLTLGADLIYKYARAFGIGKKTNIDLPYEEQGLLLNRQQKAISGRGKWFAGNTLNFSIGQGDTLTTPIQLVKMVAVVAKDGVDVQPHLIKAIDGKEVVSLSSRRPLRIDKNVFDLVKQGMKEAVRDPEGTAHVLNIPGINVAGKTGTAQSSGKQEDHAWFVGYTQKGQRNITFCVFLEHGGSSLNACLLAQELLLDLKNKEII